MNPLTDHSVLHWPKNVKFTRNAHGRVSSVIDRINYGAGNSMLRKLENVHCPITRGGQSLQLSSKSSMRWNTRDNTNVDHQCVCISVIPSLKRMQNYFDSNRNRRPEDRYLKCQLDPKPSTRKGKKRPASETPAAVVEPVDTRSRRRKTTLPTANREDHPYSLRSRKSADHRYASRK